MKRQSCCQHTGYAVQCSLKIGMPIRRKSLQRLDQNCEDREGAPDHDRSRPSEENHQREREIADEVVELPTEPRAWYPFPGAERGKYKQEQGRRAENFYHEFSGHSGRPCSAGASDAY